jgi:hypothetical protein
MTAIPGVDYSSGRPGGAALAAAGKAFAARYVSTPGNPKNITRAEADDLAAHGVWSVVVWETTANRAGAGRAAGIADAHDAVAQATAAGMPGSRPLYFAVDWDADPATVVPYFQGVASVLGLPRVGGYGGFKVIKYLLDHGLITYGWQTAAWSQGKRDPRAAIYQPATGVHINGVACDNDTATVTDYGQWMPGKTPEAPVPDLTPQIADDTKTLRSDLTKVASLTEKDAAGHPAIHPASYYLAHTHYDAVLLNTKIDGLTSQVAALAKSPGGATLTDAQVSAIAAQVAASPVLAAAVATAVVDIEAKRLQS